jgi:hypothetical protein
MLNCCSSLVRGRWDELELFDLIPIVNPLLCRAMVVEKDRDHMIDLIVRKI